jgi:type II secretory pathway pseudopilin PulG
MKTTRFQRHRTKGFALLTVLMFITVMALLTASILSYSGSERRLNERNRLLLRARNMAENVVLYASEQLTTKLYRLRSATPMAFMTGTNNIFTPPDVILTTAYSTPSDVEVRAGLTSSTGLVYVDPTLAINANNPNAGLSVSTSTIPIIAKSTMRHSSLGTLTAYAEQDLQVAMIPLFQFAVFYNMDMEFGPGPDMTISGPVHTNGDLIARIQTGHSSTLTFAERVTVAGGFFADTAHKGNTYMGDGSVDSGPGGSGPLYFTNLSGAQTNIMNSSGVWRDHKYGAAAVSATTLNQFKTFSSSTYAGNLRTSVHGVTKLELPSIGGYSEVDDPTTAVDERKNGRQLIEPPMAADTADLVQAKFSRRAGLYIIVNPDDQARMGIKPDGSTILMLPNSYRCFLNTVNSDSSHTMAEVILPGQPSYGYNDGGTPAVAGTPANTFTPGSIADDVMYKNNLPNRYTDMTAIGVNQILRIPASGRLCDAPVAAPVCTAVGATTGYKTTGGNTLSDMPDSTFYDLRRATNSTGYPYSRPANNFTPRPIAKIDFDMTRFRLMVERTINGAITSSAIFNPNAPSEGSTGYVSPSWTTANWSNSILNASATPTTYNLGINYGAIVNYSGFPTAAATPFYFADPFRLYYAPANPADPLILSNPSTFAVPVTALIDTSSPCPWFDGVTVYIESADAEDKTFTGTTLNRHDSGVRLWNGRGSIISLDGSSYPARTGCSFASNDAVYIVGHYNADGTINSTITSTGVGGYSGRYPESATEKLASVMGDAITILSQPVFVRSGSSPNYNYTQSTGWADSLSASRRSSSGWSSSWQSANPSGSNSVDGHSASLTPSRMPNLSDTGTTTASNAASGSATTQKLAPTETEISTCLLTGIVHTTSAQTSGGVHNFPRLLEEWDGTGLYIRGSMVAMFESQVGTEPWSIRYYTGAGRYWGLHDSLRAQNGAHDIPLEPVVLNAQRIRYRELSATEYAAEKTVIEALPH